MDLNLQVNGKARAGEQETSMVYSHTGYNISQFGVAPAARKSLILLVAREGIEHHARNLGFTALWNDPKLSYPRCYPRLILRKTAIEPGTLVYNFARFCSY